MAVICHYCVGRCYAGSLVLASGSLPFPAALRCREPFAGTYATPAGRGFVRALPYGALLPSPHRLRIACLCRSVLVDVVASRPGSLFLPSPYCTVLWYTAPALHTGWLYCGGTTVYMLPCGLRFADGFVLVVWLFWSAEKHMSFFHAEKKIFAGMCQPA
jgi:hypothetical protein